MDKNKKKLKSLLGKYIEELEKKKTKEKHLKQISENLFDLIETTNDFSFESIDQYLRDETIKGRSNAYVNHIIAAIHSFSLFLLYNSYPVSRDVVEYRSLKITPLLTGSLSEAEVEKLLHLTGSNSRWTIFFSIMAYSGLSPGEVARLRKSNIDIEKKVIITTSSKLLEARKIPIHEKLFPYILLVYSKTNNNDLLFQKDNAALKNEPISDSVWSYAFRTRLKAIGIARLEAKTRGLTVISLRRFYIESILKQKRSLKRVQYLVGHSNVSQTDLYRKKL